MIDHDRDVPLARAGLLAALDGARRVLITGVGGGYDVYSGIPVWSALRRAGVDVHLANYTFTYLDPTAAVPDRFGWYRVGPEPPNPVGGLDTYQPERHARGVGGRLEPQPERITHRYGT